METSYLTKKLSDVCDFKVEKNTRNLPYLGMEDIQSNSMTFTGSREPKKVKSTTNYFDETTVIYGKLRPYLNKVFVPGFEGHCTTEFVPLNPNLEYLSRDWLAYWLSSSSVIEELSGNTTGSRMPRADMKRLASMEIPLPPLAEQKKIVKVLEEKLGKVKEAILLRQDAIADTKKILPAKLNEIFASDKEKEWEEKTLGECVKLQGGNAFKSTDYQDEKGVPLIRIQNLKNEVVDLTKAVYLSYQIFEDSGNFHLESGDILIAMSGATTGKLARIKEGQLPALLNQRVGRFKVNSYAIKNFVYYFLKYKQSHILEIAYGGAQPNISGGKIEALKISLPNLKKQKQLVNELDKLVGQIDELKSLQEEQMKDLKSLERAYLHEAFSGELA
jgi:type I restriction enzyme S subunit